MVDLGAKFGISVGSDSDSSDAEFAPETAEKDSADSGGGTSSGEEGGDEEEEEEEGGDEGEKEEGGDEGEKEEEEEEEGKGEEEGEGKSETVREVERNDKEETDKDMSIAEKSVEGEEDAEMVSECVDEPGDRGSKDGDIINVGEGSEEYNPLIVRRSNRAIKPTKDVDLYLLGAKFGIDVDGLSGPESSDLEFAPADASPGNYLMEKKYFHF